MVQGSPASESSWLKLQTAVELRNLKHICLEEHSPKCLAKSFYIKTTQSVT